MGEIWQHNKRILLIYDTYLTSYDFQDHNGFFSKNTHYYSKWHNTNTTDLIFQSINTDYSEKRVSSSYQTLYGT